jgi:hypothetical protein|tara:strand:+ start:1031 stop:1207 length:177 start_codon:yes stop_codon:yes gene_type:complete
MINNKRQTVKELRVIAMMLDIDGRSSMLRAELIEAIIEREALFAKQRPGRKSSLRAVI